MDFPKSVPGVGLVDGKFVDEDQVSGSPGSLIPAKWGNDVTAEILGVLEEAGIAPDEADPEQLRAAVKAIVDKVAPVATKAEAETNDEPTADNIKRMTPLRVLQAMKARMVSASETVVGMLRVGTQPEVNAGLLDTVAVTPKKLAAIAFGAAQTGQSLLASRAINTTYTNTTGKPIFVLASINTAQGAQPGLVIDGTTIGSFANNGTGGNIYLVAFFVPAGSTYRINGGSSAGYWWEYR